MVLPAHIRWPKQHGNCTNYLKKRTAHETRSGTWSPSERTVKHFIFLTWEDVTVPHKQAASRFSSQCALRSWCWQALGFIDLPHRFAQTRLNKLHTNQGDACVYTVVDSRLLNIFIIPNRYCLHRPKCTFIVCSSTMPSARSSTPGSSSSPSSSWRRWTLQRARCLNTAWPWGTLPCECHFPIAPQLPGSRHFCALIITWSASERCGGQQLMFCFSSHFQKKQRSEWKSTEKVTISSPCSVCKGKYLIFLCRERKEKSTHIVANVVCLPADAERDSGEVSGGHGPGSGPAEGGEVQPGQRHLKPPRPKADTWLFHWQDMIVLKHSHNLPRLFL